MDVCILAGGKGTRLEGVWSGPKCLVPVGGSPLLARIVAKLVLEIQPINVLISLGSQTRGLEVIQWWFKDNPGPWCNLESKRFNINFALEPVPLGRHAALRYCLPALTPPIMVLNGDTLPLYDLRQLGTGAVIAQTEDGTHAGAFILDETAATMIQDFRGSWDLDAVVSELIPGRTRIAGFLDVGTPEGFAKAQQFNATEA